MIPGLVVCSLTEAEAWARDARAVVSIVNPGTDLFAHPNGLVLRCYDVDLPGNPLAAGRPQVEAVVDFARRIGPEPGVLVHCNWGQSRSPAAAWAMLIAWGHDPADALAALRAAHPAGRPFHPNRLMVDAIDDVLGLPRGTVPRALAST